MSNMVAWENESVAPASRSEWREPTAYRIHILITKDEYDTYSAVALNLPGAGSSGSTEEEALERAKEAIRGVLEEYAASGMEIPWRETRAANIPHGAVQKWIIVHA